MHRFYVIDQHTDVNTIAITGSDVNTIAITGSDVNHIKNVLRMKPGDGITICNGQGKDCYCIIKSISETLVKAEIISAYETDTELPAKITLFQGLPKSDKMELIIQKAVELGVYAIAPVVTSRCIVKLEDKKKEAKRLERWQAIAENAAKQSKRGYIPRILPVMTYQDAVHNAGSMGLSLIPYENALGMQLTKDIIKSVGKYTSIGIIIGPEGGFEDAEIELAEEYHIIPISLGRRILRTETAGFAILSMLMLELEKA